MTEMPQPPPWEQQADEGAPVPGAAPAPVPPRDRIAELEAELARLRSAALDGARAVLRVQPPHSSFTHGGITVHDSPTPVPQRALGALLTAAAEAGVTITEEG